MAVSSVLSIDTQSFMLPEKAWFAIEGLLLRRTVRSAEDAACGMTSYADAFQMVDQFCARQHWSYTHSTTDDEMTVSLAGNVSEAAAAINAARSMWLHPNTAGLYAAVHLFSPRGAILGRLDASMEVDRGSCSGLSPTWVR